MYTVQHWIRGHMRTLLKTASGPQQVPVKQMWGKKIINTNMFQTILTMLLWNLYLSIIYRLLCICVLNSFQQCCFIPDKVCMKWKMQSSVLPYFDVYSTASRRETNVGWDLILIGWVWFAIPVISCDWQVDPPSNWWTRHRKREEILLRESFWLKIMRAQEF